MGSRSGKAASKVVSEGKAVSKPRELHDVIQVNLRMRVAEHAWLTEQAKANHVTLNGEMMARIMSTKEQRALLTVHQLMENASRLLQPYTLDAHARSIYADALNASERLLALVEPLIAADLIGGRTGEQIRAAADSFRLARRVVELEAGARLVRQGTTGSDTESVARKVRGG